MPQKRNLKYLAKQFEIGTEEGSHSATVDDHYRQAGGIWLLQASQIGSINLVMPFIATLKICWSLLVVSVANGEPFNDLFTFDSMGMILIHHNYLHSYRILGHFSGNAENFIHECLVALQNMFFTQKEFSVKFVYWRGSFL